jgi:hypothetical protein
MKDRTLEVKLLVSNLEELLYTFGDPRPMLLNYILSRYSGVETFHDLKTQGYKNNEVFTHKCVPHSKKENMWVRSMALPKPDILQKFHNLLNTQKTQAGAFVIIPFLMINKSQCMVNNKLNNNTSKHLMYGLYNRKTKELERIDIKKYHIKDFKIKLAYKKINMKLVPMIGENTTFISEHDVTRGIMRRLGTDQIKYAYPVFLMSYLHERFMHPEETSKMIYKRVNRLSRMALIENFQIYVFYREEHKNAVSGCPNERIKNLETNKCIRDIAKYSSDPVIKQCKSNLSYDLLKNRCVKQERISHINVEIDNVLKQNINRKTKLKSLGDVVTILSSTMFVLSKHPDARLVVPVMKTSSPQEKTEYCFVWAWDEERSLFDLKIPEGFWDAWADNMLSPARFLVVLLSLVSESGGFHANVLIYDKTTHEMERFDGLGNDTALSYSMTKCDMTIKELFNSHMGTHVPHTFKYFTPIDYCPRKAAVFQSKELDQIGFDDLTGNCAIWRLWYIDTRLGNPHLDRKQVIQYATKTLDNFGNYPKFIKSYQAYILKEMAAHADNLV